MKITHLTITHQNKSTWTSPMSHKKLPKHKDIMVQIFIFIICSQKYILSIPLAKDYH